MLNIKFSYNKVKPLPIISNYIGIDKLIFDIEKNSIMLDKLKSNESSSWVSDKTGEVHFTKGRIMDGIEYKIFNNSVKFTINPSIVLYGNNFYSTSLIHLKYVIELLKEIIDVDVMEAIIRRIDLQSTLQMDFSPKFYFSQLGNRKNYIRQQVGGTSLYYSSKGKEKYKTTLLYDKKIKSRKNIPLEYCEGNYLRKETQYYNRFLKNVAKKLKIDAITINMLFDEEIYTRFLIGWFADYETIYKEVEKVLDMSKVNKPSDLDDVLINLGVSKFGGMVELERTINASKPFSKKKSDFFSKTIKRYRDKSNKQNCIIDSPVLRELNSKVEESYFRTLSVEWFGLKQN